MRVKSKHESGAIVSVRLSPQELAVLEEKRAELRARHGISCSRGDVLRAALSFCDDKKGGGK